MTGRASIDDAKALLTDLTTTRRTTGGVEIATLLEAWGFVHGGPVDVVQPERVIFWIHPEHPELHMTVPIGGPLSPFVVEYAAHLIRSLKDG